MDDLRTLMTPVLSVASIVLTLYLWLVKMNRERPRFRIVATSPVERAVSMKTWRADRTELVGKFVHAEDAAKLNSPAGVGSYCFLFRTMIVNQSSIPHAVGAVRVSAKGPDGKWVGLNTAFVSLESGIGGPFNLNWENMPGRGPIEPQNFVVTPEKGAELKLLAWFDVPLGADEFTWRRVGTDQVVEHVKAFAETRLAQPLAMRVEITTVQGKLFAAEIDTTGTTLPRVVTVAGIPTPPLPAFPEALRPKQIDEAVQKVRATIAENAEAASGLVVLEGERVESYDTDLEPTVYGALTSLAVGLPLNADAGREWLAARQQPDGTFRQTGGKLDPASPAARMTNIYLGTLGLYALGAKPAADPLPAFAAALSEYLRVHTEDDKPASGAFAVQAVQVAKMLGAPLSPDLEKGVAGVLAAMKPLADRELNVESGVWVPTRLAELRGEATTGHDGRLARILGRRGSDWRDDENEVTCELLAKGYRSARLLGLAVPYLDRLRDELVQRSVDYGVRGGIDGVKVQFFVVALLIAAKQFTPSVSPSDAVAFGIGEHA